MDPVTAVGLAASAIQLVELGAKLSVKLFTVSKQLKNAAGYYEAIGQNVASTNAVVQQLGMLLNDEKHQRLFGIEAIRTMTQSITACRKLFNDLYEDITPKARADSSSAVKTLAEWKHRLVLPYKQAELERKQSKIDELKTMLTLNLNIVVLAMQISLHDQSDAGKAILLEQRDAVRALHKATTLSHSKANPSDWATPLLSNNASSNSRSRTLLLDFRKLLDESYFPRIENLVQDPAADDSARRQLHHELWTAIDTGYREAAREMLSNGEDAYTHNDVEIKLQNDVQTALARLEESLKTRGQSPEPLRSPAVPPARKANASLIVLDDRPRMRPEQRLSDSTCSPDRPQKNKKGAIPEADIRDFDEWRISNDRARFKAHARLVEEVLALLERNSEMKMLRIQSDMHSWALKFHHDFWSKLGRRYCLRKLLPGISDCPLVFEYWLDEDSKRTRRRKGEKLSRRPYRDHSLRRERDSGGESSSTSYSSNESNPDSEPEYDREYFRKSVKSENDHRKPRGHAARYLNLPIDVAPRFRPRAANRDGDGQAPIINMGSSPLSARSRWEERHLPLQDDSSASSGDVDEDAELVGLLSQFTTLTGDDLAFLSSLDKERLESTAI